MSRKEVNETSAVPPGVFTYSATKQTLSDPPIGAAWKRALRPSEIWSASAAARKHRAERHSGDA